MQILFFYLIYVSNNADGSEFRILNFDKCTGHEKYMIVDQCEGKGNVVNARARIISTIESIIVSLFFNSVTIKTF